MAFLIGVPGLLELKEKFSLLLTKVNLVLFIQVFQVLHVVNIQGLGKFADFLEVNIADKAEQGKIFIAAYDHEELLYDIAIVLDHKPDIFSFAPGRQQQFIFAGIDGF